MNIESYLKRINQGKITKADFETLAQLQMSHLLHVPFENLDVMRHVKIPLDVETYYKKVVEHNRGGFCYELNGLFQWLLESLGYKTRLVGGSVRSPEGKWSMEGSHAALIVELDQPYFVDVGFGDSARQPIPFTGEVRRDVSNTYRIIPFEDGLYDLQRKDDEDNWVTRLRFSKAPRKLSDFKEQCHYNQTSPDSHFTHRELASIATEDGRITLSGNKLTITQDGEKTERLVSDGEKAEILKKYFGIVLD